MMAYEQTLRLFERWCMEEMKIVTVEKVIAPPKINLKPYAVS